VGRHQKYEAEGGVSLQPPEETKKERSTKNGKHNRSLKGSIKSQGKGGNKRAWSPDEQEPT
jgi:hypothetical protein